MGMYLPKPKTTKHSEDGGTFPVTVTRYGVTAMQGWRLYMEDAHIADPDYSVNGQQGLGLYGVFDGHGGPAVSTWVSMMFKAVFESELMQVHSDAQKEINRTNKIIVSPSVTEICEALRRTFLRLDVEMSFADNRELLRKLHHELQYQNQEEEASQKSSEEEEEKPSTLLDLLVSRIKSEKAQLRIYNINGQRYVEAQMRETRENSVTDSDPASSPTDQSGDTEAFLNFFSVNTESNEDKFNQDGASPTHTDDISVNQEVSPSSVKSGQSTLALNENESTSTGVNKEDITPHETKKETVEELIDHPQTSNLTNSNSETSDNIHMESQSAIVTQKNDTYSSKDSYDKYYSEYLDSAELPNSSDKDCESVAREAIEQDSSFDLASEGDQPESCGSTAIVVIVTKAFENSPPALIIANAGDSRAVLSRNKCAVPLSKDHKPILKGETRRIMKAGGKVISGRVDGNLNLSRALGDLHYKKNQYMDPEEQKIVSNPDIRVVPLEPGDEFVIIACDGIWDCLSNQEAVNFVHSRLEYLDPSEDAGSVKISKICEEMCDTCLSKNPLKSEGGIGCDNMTVVIVMLKDNVKNMSNEGIQELDIDSVCKFYGEYNEEDYEESAAEMSDDSFFI